MSLIENFIEFISDFWKISSYFKSANADQSTKQKHTNKSMWNSAPNVSVMKTLRLQRCECIMHECIMHTLKSVSHNVLDVNVSHALIVIFQLVTWRCWWNKLFDWDKLIKIFHWCLHCRRWLSMNFNFLFKWAF